MNIPFLESELKKQLVLLSVALTVANTTVIFAARLCNESRFALLALKVIIKEQDPNLIDSSLPLLLP
jgi:hypothetical protein